MERPMGEMIEPSYIDRSSRQYTECVLNSSYKLTAVEPGILKRMRKSQVLKLIQRIENMTDDDREELMDSLTTIVSSYESIDDPETKSSELLSEASKISKIADRFDDLRHLFRNRFTDEEKMVILKDVTIKTKQLLTIPFQYLREDLVNFKDTILEEMIVTRRILYECIKLAHMAEDDLVLSRRMDRVQQKLAWISLALLRLEAARRGKMSYEALYNDIAILGSVTVKGIPEAGIGSIQEVLGLEI